MHVLHMHFLIVPDVHFPKKVRNADVESGRPEPRERARYRVEGRRPCHFDVAWHFEPPGGTFFDRDVPSKRANAPGSSPLHVPLSSWRGPESGSFPDPCIGARTEQGQSSRRSRCGGSAGFVSPGDASKAAESGGFASAGGSRAATEAEHGGAERSTARRHASAGQRGRGQGARRACGNGAALHESSRRAAPRPFDARAGPGDSCAGNRGNPAAPHCQGRRAEVSLHRAKPAHRGYCGGSHHGWDGWKGRGGRDHAFTEPSFEPGRARCRASDGLRAGVGQWQTGAGTAQEALQVRAPVAPPFRDAGHNRLVPPRGGKALDWNAKRSSVFPAYREQGEAIEAQGVDRRRSRNGLSNSGRTAGPQGRFIRDRGACRIPRPGAPVTCRQSFGRH